MKLNDLRVKVDRGRTERDKLHEQLHDLLDDKTITVGEREQKEGDIRAAIKAINLEIFPCEVVVGKARKVMKGKTDKDGNPIDPLEKEERELYDRCAKEIGGLEI